MAEMPDRRKVNMEIDRIISRYRNGTGAIPPLAVSDLARDLKAHMDASIGHALDYGSEIGRVTALQDPAPTGDLDA